MHTPSTSVPLLLSILPTMAFLPRHLSYPTLNLYVSLDLHGLYAL